jgi:hypothetical protein
MVVTLHKLSKEVEENVFNMKISKETSINLSKNVIKNKLNLPSQGDRLPC